MPWEWNALTLILAILWFLAYWIFGGVFFAAMALLQLGRVRKVRFSCLYTILCLFAAACVSIQGLRISRGAIVSCLERAETKAETITAVFGCGFAGVFGTFLLGAAGVVLGGFIIMALSRSTQKPWIVLESGTGTLETAPPEPVPLSEETETGEEHGEHGVGHGSDNGHD